MNLKQIGGTVIDMKITKIILLGISLVWTIVNFFKAVASPDVVNITNFVGVIPIIAGLYSEIDWIYINCNKLKAYFLLKTVNFTVKSSRYIMEDTQISEVEKIIRKILKASSYKIDEASFSKTHEDLYFYITSQNNIHTKLTINLHPESLGSRLTIKMNYQVAYRDVTKQWKKFIELRNGLFSNFSIKYNTKERYDITIETDTMRKYNPFYRLTVRHIGEASVKDFKLNFKDEALSVTTYMNKIYATSDKCEDIEKVLNDYVPLSRNL